MLKSQSQVKFIKTSEQPHSSFKSRVVNKNVISCYQSTADDRVGLEKAFIESKEGIEALQAKDSLQEMLAAQMLSIHELQQTSMFYANNTNHPEAKKYYTNTAIKLANCFTQQATLLSKLQGTFGQQIVVKHVEVNNGGQAVVGNITGITSKT